jgi:thioredoxin reductase
MREFRWCFGTESAGISRHTLRWAGCHTLLTYARKVYVVVRGDGLKETLSQYLIDRISASPQIEVRPHTEILELHGTKELEAITLIDNLSGQQQTIQTC